VIVACSDTCRCTCQCKLHAINDATVQYYYACQLSVYPLDCMLHHGGRNILGVQKCASMYVALRAAEDRIWQQCYCNNVGDFVALQHGDNTAEEESKTVKNLFVSAMGKSNERNTWASRWHSRWSNFSAKSFREDWWSSTEIKILQDKLAYVLSYLGNDDLGLGGPPIESFHQSSHPTARIK
jgi:hypothetical protein